jgi:hypothetical protein
MTETKPHSIVHEKILIREDLSFDQHFKVITDGGRIKQGAKGIDQYREFMIEHPPADFFGKTRAHEQATALVADLFPGGGEFNHCAEPIHMI